jgi:hypothetical protein
MPPDAYKLSEPHCLLSVTQLDKFHRLGREPLFRWVNGKRPVQYGFDFGLWTRQIVQELLVSRFDVQLSLASIGTMLARLGLTAQKPLERAYQRDPEAVARWKDETFPAIAKEDHNSGAEILFWDESGFRADAVHGKTCAPRGQTPIHFSRSETACDPCL